VRPLVLDMWVELDPGEAQDELLAAAYFADRQLSTSVGVP
jgi:hypothetical protein